MTWAEDLRLTGAAAPASHRAAPAIPGTGDPIPPDQDSFPLHLLVILNGQDTGKIAQFTWFGARRRIGVSAAELREIGLSPPPGERAPIMLDTLPGLSYRYDEAAQEIHISAAPRHLARRIIRARHRPEYADAQPGHGAVLNYRLTGTLGSDVLADGFRVQNIFSSLEGRLYAPFGVLRTTGSLSAQNVGLDGARFKRDDTTFSYSSPRTMLTFNAGDIISSGHSWTRPIRMGGVQIRRDFALRSDIVTDPQLAYSGTAAVPTAVDVYVDNINAWSGTIPAGPYTLTDLPMINDSGETTIVIRDAAGNEETKTIGFFATENLLGRGQLDFSFEAGVARNSYATENFAYGADRMASASLRYGLSDRLTLHGHVEGSADLIAGSAGFSSALFNRAEVGFSLGASRFRGETGYLGHFDLRTAVAGADLRFSSTRHSGGYADLAYATALAEGAATDPALLRPAKAQDVLSVSAPMSASLGTLGVNLINLERADKTNTILSGAYTRRANWRDSQFRISGFKELNSRDFGVSMGLSVPIGQRARASSDLRSGPAGRPQAGLHLRRMLDQDVGSYGYRADLYRDENGENSGFLSGSYRGRYGVVEARMQAAKDGKLAAAASLEGALVLNGAGLIAGNRINNGFAVVDLGVRDTPVLLHNHPVAKTGAMGKALVPGLVPYQYNRVSVRPSDLPLATNINATAMMAVPARGAGVTLRMGRGESASALVVLRDAQGEFIPVGAEVTVNGRRSEFVVGYDGEVWLERLRRTNRIKVDTGGSRCSAEFALPPEEDAYLELECLQ